MPAKVSVSDVKGEVNYENLIREFGVQKFDKYVEKMRELGIKLDLMYRRGIVFAHRDFERILNAIKNKEEFAVVTGINPSSPLHFGHLLFLRQAKFFQELGANVFIPISNDETYVFKKTEELEKATKNAMENVIPDIIALGFKKNKTKFFISTRYSKIYELAVKLSTKVTFSTIKAIFGFNEQTNPGQIFYAIIQSAHILLPQLEEFGGKKPTVVPIGIDQDPYLRLVRDISEKFGFIKPSSTYHKFLPGLLGGKMSGSKPNTCIFLNDDIEVAKQKIKKAFSGGPKTLAEHRKYGGNPEIDVACQYLYFLFEENDKKIEEIFENFRNGKLTCGDVKEYLSRKIEKFLKEHQAKREKAKNLIDKFLIY